MNIPYQAAPIERGISNAASRAVYPANGGGTCLCKLKKDECVPNTTAKKCNSGYHSSCRKSGSTCACQCVQN